MRLTFAVALLLAVVPAKPEREAGPYGAVFCEDLESLRLWMTAMLERPEHGGGAASLLRVP